MRVFAGPNGSGKSTIINSVKNYRVNNTPVDFGIYINADDIAKALRENAFTFTLYEVSATNEEFKAITLSSGLIGIGFNEQEFNNAYIFKTTTIRIKKAGTEERIAQMIAHFLRKKLLHEKKKFSFETVFSHSSKLDIISEAVEAGYKVYLYFVATESPAINKYRVEERTRQGGHYVNPQKIEDRYYRSLEQLYKAVQLVYQAYFFDNSKDETNFNFFAHFKKIKNEKKWDAINPDDVPNWFIKYYINKER